MGNPRRILVIDDDPSVRKAFALALDDPAYEVTAAASGDEGIALARARRFDLVYLDLKMPGRDGVETLLALRSGGVAVPIYIVTSFHEDFSERLREAAERGVAFEVVRKPLDRWQILSVTRGVLEGPQLA